MFGGGVIKRLALAWIASSAAFAIASVAKQKVYGWLDGAALLPIRPEWLLRPFLFAFCTCLIFQLVYGGTTYFVLARSGLWQLWTVAICYLMPVFVVGVLLSDTVPNLMGIVSWAVLALIVAVVSWFFARPQDEARQSSRTGYE